MEKRRTDDERTTRSDERVVGCDGTHAGTTTDSELSPVCAVLGTMSSAPPEVTRHLLATARGLVAALSAAVDAYPGVPPGTCTWMDRTEPPGSGSLRRIAVA